MSQTSNEIPANAVEVGRAESGRAGSYQVHLFFPDGIGESRDQLIELANAGRIYSVFVLALDSTTSQVIELTSAVPVFIASSTTEAESLAFALVRSPVKTCVDALNGAEVLTKYLEGHPS